jgi:hypothetical protein
VHQNAAAAANRRRNYLHRAIHAGQRAGIGQVVKRGPEESARGARFGVAALNQDGRERLRQRQLGREAPNGGWIRTGRDHPSEGKRGRGSHRSAE